MLHKKMPLHGKERGEDREITTIRVRHWSGRDREDYRLNTFIAPPPGAALNLTSSL